MYIMYNTGESEDDSDVDGEYNALDSQRTSSTY